MAGKGIIVMWSGNLNQIPNGWLLCNGNFGTPDLRDRFIRGAPDGVDPGGSGGSPIHTHNFTGDGHTHDLAIGLDVGAGVNLENITSEVAATGTTDPGSSFPPYYRLAFLMKE